MWFRYTRVTHSPVETTTYSGLTFYPDYVRICVNGFINRNAEASLRPRLFLDTTPFVNQTVDKIGSRTQVSFLFGNISVTI